MIRFLLIRHATTDAVGRRLSGRKPGVPLNEAGQEQAQSLAGRLAHLPITALYSSPLERAVQTAAPLGEALGLQTVTEENFLELDFGNWTDRSFEDLGPDPAFQLFNSFRSIAPVPGGESMLEAQARMVGGLQQLFLRHRNETVAVVGHSDLIKAALAYYAGIHLDLFQRIEISPASVSILEVFEETARIVLLNDTGRISR